MIQAPTETSARTPRRPTSAERAVLAKLLAGDFPGVQDLRRQAASLRVMEALADGTLDLHVDADAPRADVESRVPVEAAYDDEDGVPVMILMHVLNGVLAELEVVKADGSPIARPPAQARLDVTERLVRGVTA